MDVQQDLETVELVTRPTQSTQFYLFNLFADYIVPRGGRIWTSDLLYLLDLLEVSERAARSTLSRMKKRGWFITRREGRESQYLLTSRGQAILAQGEQRIFEEPFTDWDKQWRLVVYSLPEELRAERNELRTKLIWLGFGSLAPGTWISPHPREEDVFAIFSDLDVRDYVAVFTGDTPARDEEIVRECWDIAVLAADYREFLARYRPEYEANKAAEAGGQAVVTPEEAFLRRWAKS
jgi:phenylacetic acid degradation operon negative regulatory protein